MNSNLAIGEVSRQVGISLSAKDYSLSGRLQWPMALKRKGVPGRQPVKAPVKLYLGEWMARLGRKAVEIARAADVTESYISELASGKKPNPSLPVLFAIVDELGISVNDLRRPPPPASALEAAQKLDPGQIAALGKLLDNLKK